MPVMSAAFAYTPHFPPRSDVNAMRRPSGDQIGEELSWAASNVKRDVVPRDTSVTQMSPPASSCRCAATCVPSGERSSPL